jgi:purine-binding chemotaxis protein CheW
VTTTIQPSAQNSETENQEEATTQEQISSVENSNQELHPHASAQNSEIQNQEEATTQEKISTVEKRNLELQRHLEKAVFIDDKTQFLIFEVKHGDYALDILTVREILDILPVTKVPGTPAFMLGVINLRGAVVPVVDLKQRFGFEAQEYTEDSCIIIIEIDGNGSKSRIFGLLVDAVQEVISLTPENINEVSKMGIHIDTKFLKGVGNYRENFVLIMDLEKVLPVNEPF